MRVALQKNPKPIDLSNVISGLGGDPTDNSAAYHVQSGIYSGTSTPDYGSYKFQVTVNSQNHMIHIQSLTTVSSWGVVTIDMDCSGMHYSGGAANACSVIAPSASTYWGGINSDGSLSFGNSLADNAGFSFFDIVP
jgi:hypothetical protein